MARAPLRRLKSYTSLPGLPHRAEAALTVSLGRLVNPGSVIPFPWTWTRGGWRERYPENIAHARR